MKLSFTLKQHTPLIHFQHNQTGATLRATELKPKLDRYLLQTVLGNGNYEKGIQIAKANGWLIGQDERPALNYKVRVVPKDMSTPTDIPSSYPCFFAAMGDDYKKHPKKFVFHKEPLKLEIFCFFKELKEDIEKHIADFFSQTNFGMRQSKGFGSFTVDKEIVKGAAYSFTVDKNSEKTMFDAINLFYRSLRGGVRDYTKHNNIIECKFYFKSLLVAFFHDYLKNSGTWDKAAIKQGITEKKTTVANGVDIKDLLGFSTNETWGNKTIKKVDKRQVEIEILEKGKQTKENEKKIEEIKKVLVTRFTSPLLFKPIHDGKKWTVYIFIRPVPEHYRGTTVVASSNGKTVELKMSDLIITDFMDFVAKYKDTAKLEGHLEKYDREGEYDKFVEHFSFKSLKKIFEKLNPSTNDK